VVSELLIEESYHLTRSDPVIKKVQGRSVSGKTCDEGSEMPTKIRSSIKSWMLFYVAFVIALTSGGMGGDSSAASVSPGTYPTETTADRVFFESTIERPRRNDI